MDAAFCYNSLENIEHLGAARVGTEVDFKLYIRDDIFVSTVTLVVIRDCDKHKFKCSAHFARDDREGYYYYQTSFLPRSADLYWYCFEITQNKHTFYVSAQTDLSPFSGSATANFWQLTAINHNASYSTIMQGKTMYHIFVDRFNRGNYVGTKQNAVLREDWGGTPYYLPINGKILNNDFFQGNIAGIIDKLDYLSELNIGILYLSPIFQAASNHRYDTSDYGNIDELLGSEDDFKRLCDECRKRDIIVILDGVFNHTGDDSVYFNKYGHYNSVGAFQSPQSPYYNWYDFSSYPDHYKSWWGIDTLPSVNQSSEKYRNYICGDNGILKKWIKLGAAGYRLDVVDEIGDEFLDPICSAIKSEGNDKVIIGEVWEDASNKTAYSKRRRYFLGGQLDSVMNYPIKEATIDFICSGNSWNFILTVKTILNNYPKDVTDNLMNILSTHDTARILTILSCTGYPQSRELRAKAKLSESQLEKAIHKLKMASLIQFTIFGVPCIYYGDEVGIEGYEDPFNRRCYPWGSENMELLAWYKKLSQLRADCSSFNSGNFKFLHTSENAVVYSRDNDKIVIGINLSASPIDINLSGEYINYLSGKCEPLKLDSNSYCIYILTSQG